MTKASASAWGTPWPTNHDGTWQRREPGAPDHAGAHEPRTGGSGFMSTFLLRRSHAGRGRGNVGWAGGAARPHLVPRDQAPTKNDRRRLRSRPPVFRPMGGMSDAASSNPVAVVRDPPRAGKVPSSDARLRVPSAEPLRPLATTMPPPGPLEAFVVSLRSAPHAFSVPEPAAPFTASDRVHSVWKPHAEADHAVRVGVEHRGRRRGLRRLRAHWGTPGPRTSRPNPA